MKAGFVWVATLFSFSALFALFFAYAAAALARYSPVYAPIECTPQASRLGNTTVDATWVNATGTFEKSCWNPNAYTVRLSELSPGTVFVNSSSLREAGQSFLQGADIPARGRGTLETVVRLVMPKTEALALLRRPIVQVVLETRSEFEAAFRFLGHAFSSGEERTTFCGFEVQMVANKAGHMACAASLPALVIADVDTEEAGVELLHMSPEQSASMARKRNLTFGLAMGLSAALALALLACGLVKCASTLQGRAARCPKEAPEAAPGKQPENEVVAGPA